MNEEKGWQIDEKGRRYRLNGHVREYEMIVYIDGHEIPQSELANYHQQKNKQAGLTYKVPGSQKICPFNRAALDPRCKGESCAWWNEGCAISSKKAATGGICPVSGGFVMHCTVQCVAYDNGCLLANAGIFDTIKKEEHEG